MDLLIQPLKLLDQLVIYTFTIESVSSSVHAYDVPIHFLFKDINLGARKLPRADLALKQNIQLCKGTAARLRNMEKL